MKSYFYVNVAALLTPEKNRTDSFDPFLKWLNNNGVDTQSIEITEFPEVGFGLKTTKDLKVSLILILHYAKIFQ